MSWENSVRTQADANVTGHTTGGMIWQAARAACQFFERMQHDIGMSREGVRILELGAGCGLLGLALAANLPHAAEVCLTEQPGLGLQHLQANVDINSHIATRITVCACDWQDYADSTEQHHATDQLVANIPHDSAEEQGFHDHSHDHAAPSPPTSATPAQHHAPIPPLQPFTTSPGPSSSRQHISDPAAAKAQLLATQWDFIIGSDLVYNSIGTHMLPRTLRALCRPGGHIYYCHTKHRYDHCDLELLEQLEAVGLACSEVRTPEQGSPPASPPPLTEVFPELRIAMFHMELGQGEGKGGGGSRGEQGGGRPEQG